MAAASGFWRTMLCKRPCTCVCVSVRVRVRVRDHSLRCRNPMAYLMAHLMAQEEGNPTTDPDVMFQEPYGAAMPFGGHRGGGLALMNDLLAGILTGGHTCRQVPVHLHVCVCACVCVCVSECVCVCVCACVCACACPVYMACALTHACLFLVRPFPCC